MVTINDFKYIKLQSRNMFKFIPNISLENLDEIKKARLGFYHLILEKMTGLADASDVQNLIQDQEYVEITNGIAEKDLGIDAVYINKENTTEKEIMLFNFKYRKDFNPDKTTSENDISTSMKFFQYLKNDSRLPTNINKDSKVYQNILNIRKCLRSDDIYKITLYMVTNEAKGLSEDADKIAQAFSENYDMNIIAISIEDIISFIDIKKEIISSSIIFPTNDFVGYKSDEKSTAISYICKLSLLDLIRITSNNKIMRETHNWDNINEEQFKNVNIQHSVLYDNVRGYLGSTNYNKKITETIKNDPKNFFMFNNGITITSENISCSSVNLGDKYVINLNDFQIVNGGQTLRSAYNYFLDSTQEDRLKKLLQSKVLVRIFKIENAYDPMKNFISEFTNSQNAISEIDLKAVSHIQLEIERYLKAQNILYIRKAGDVGDLEQIYAQRISMEKFTQILFAIQGFPEKVGNAKKKLFSEYYDTIYNPNTFKIEECAYLIELYFEVIKHYTNKNEPYYDQKIFYILFFIKEFDLSISKAEEFLEALLKNYGSNEKDARKLLRTDFKLVSKSIISEYIVESKNDNFEIYSKKIARNSKNSFNAFKITNDPDAAKIQLTDEEILKQYPFTYKNIVDKCNIDIENFKQNKIFNSIMSELKKDPALAFVRKLNPKSLKSSSTTFYSLDIINEIKIRYTNNN